MSKDKLKKPKVKQIFFTKDGKEYKPDPKKMMMKAEKRMSGGMAHGGGKKNYKATGTINAKTGKLVGGQKNLPKHLQKAILA